MSSQMGPFKTGEGVEPGKRVFDDNGFDVTPKPLSYTPLSQRRKASVRSKYEENETEGASRLGGVGAGKKPSKDGVSQRKPAAAGQALEKDYLKELEIVKETLKTCKLDMEEATVKPATVVLYLEESAHQWHLYMSSTNYVKTEDTEVQTELSGATERRYRLASTAQTFNPVTKKKVSQTAPIELSTSCVFASEWDLYDTYRRLSYEDEEPELDSQDLELELEMAGGQRPSVASESTLSQSNEQQPIIASRRANLQAQKVMRLPEFQSAATVAERLLASNSFLPQQLAFTGPARQEQEITTGFHYIMNELWSFSCEDSRNRIVNAVSWNVANMSVLAVGYGYVRGGEEPDGLVCCWSVKNPAQPERVFPLNSPVTSVSFSRASPNLLAVGCYNGGVIVINISSKSGDLLVLNGEEGCLRYGSVGNLQWFFHTDFVVETEEIISVAKNGRVYKWNYLEGYRSYEIMQLSYFQPNIKDATKKPTKVKKRFKNILKHLSGLSVSLHPKNRMVYYVSTQEGCVVKCAMNRQDRFEDIFPAHAGPVYGILHSPFSEHIFLTYGSDWQICIWVEGLREPLCKLYYTKLPVMGVSWSPTHSTILASISGSHLSMWDLARKTIVPINTIKSSSGNVFTSVQFSTTGKNIVAGDVLGEVFVFNLVDMPYPPFLQEEALMHALQKALVSKPQQRSFLDKYIKIKTSTIHKPDHLLS